MNFKMVKKEIEEHFKNSSKSEFYRLFAKHKTRVEGWFMGEIMFVLGELKKLKWDCQCWIKKGKNGYFKKVNLATNDVPPRRKGCKMIDFMISPKEKKRNLD